MNTAVLSQGLLSMIVVLGLHGTYSPIVNLSGQYIIVQFYYVTCMYSQIVSLLSIICNT